MLAPLVAGLGPQEVVIIALVLVMLFGAKKLPELARGSGRALRIFKAETKGLHDDDTDDGYDEYDDSPTGRQRELRAQADARRDPVLDAEATTETRPETRTER